MSDWLEQVAESDCQEKNIFTEIKNVWNNMKPEWEQRDEGVNDQHKEISSFLLFHFQTKIIIQSSLTETEEERGNNKRMKTWKRKKGDRETEKKKNRINLEKNDRRRRENKRIKKKKNCEGGRERAKRKRDEVKEEKDE